MYIVLKKNQKSTLEWSGNKPRASITDKPTSDDADQEEAGDDDDDDEEERFVDLPLPAEFQDEDADDRVQAVTADAAADTDGVVAEGGAKAGRSANPQTGVSSWVHRQNLKGGFCCWKMLCTALPSHLRVSPMLAFITQNFSHRNDVPPRMDLWWSLCTLYLHAFQVKVTVGDSDLCCPCVAYFKR